MFEFLKRKKEYPIDANEQYKEIETNFLQTVTPDYIEAQLPHLYRQLEDRFYRTFDFVRLYTPSEPQGGLLQYMPYITVGLLLLLTIKSFL